MRKIPVQKVLLHLTGCLLFLSLPILFSPESLPLPADLHHPPAQYDFLFYGLLIAVFYSQYYFFIPRFLYTKRYVLYGLILLSVFFLIFSLPRMAEGRGRPSLFSLPGSTDEAPPHDELPGNFRPREDTVSALVWRPEMSENQRPAMGRYGAGLMQRKLFLFLAVICVCLLLRVRDRLKLTEKEKMLTELAFLKAQINPHFLFHSLNTIYSLALEKSDQAPRAVVKLSDMMRYVLEDAGSEGVTLFREIDHLKNYIALQQMRFGNAVTVDLRITGATENRRIAPLLLIPFVENAFMHGVSPESPSLIRIRIESLPGEFRMEVSNRKFRSPETVQKAGGVGLTNVRRRLDLFYPQSHRLEITGDGSEFVATLILDLP